jgi:hypothetical protein
MGVKKWNETNRKCWCSVSFYFVFFTVGANDPGRKSETRKQEDKNAGRLR